MDIVMRIGKGFALVILLAGLTACTGGMGDLNSWISEVKARPGGRIEPLPQVQPYETFVYEAYEFRSPFEAPVAAVAGGAGITGPTPDPTRSKEFLEQYSLDTLNMVGTMDLGGTVYGLVQTGDGLVHRVVVGNYLGTNDGHITEITEQKIDLVEIISDGLGGYIERPAAIGLDD